MDLTWFGWVYLILSLIGVALFTLGLIFTQKKGYCFFMLLYSAFILWGIFGVGVQH